MQEDRQGTVKDAGALAAMLLVACVAGAAPVPPRETTPSAPMGPTLFFERNEGQLPSEVRFVVRGRGATAWLTDRAVVFPSGTRLTWQDARVKAEPTALEPLASRSSYFRGNDPSLWCGGLANYAAVRYSGIGEGVDLLFRGSADGKLEYDLVLAPGVDPGDVRMRLEDYDEAHVDDAGELVATGARGTLRQRLPVVWEEAAGGRVALDASYRIARDGSVSIDVPGRDPRRALVIDPVFEYATFLGGSDNDRGFGIAADAAGNAFVVGTTKSADFPLLGSPGGPILGWDAFVTSYDPAGALRFSVALGGADDDVLKDVAIGLDGSIHVVGYTRSSDFPTRGAVQPALGGSVDVVVVKLLPDGSDLVFSTYWGGGVPVDPTFAADENPSGVALDAAGNVFVAGTTQSSDFPVRSPYQAAHGGTPPCSPCSPSDGFLLKLSADGQTVAYATYLGGPDTDSVNALAVDATGAVYVTGDAQVSFPLPSPIRPYAGGTYDVYVIRFDGVPPRPTWSTFLGGDGSEGARAIAVDAAQDVYLAGSTLSANFPVVNAFDTTLENQDGFVAKLAAGGTVLAYASFLGGELGEIVEALAVDPEGGAWVAGRTDSTDFPVVLGDARGFASRAGFVSHIDPSGSRLVWSTGMGLTSVEEDVHALALDGAGFVHIAGETRSPDFPVRNAAQPAFGGGPIDTFVAKTGCAGLPGPVGNTLLLARDPVLNLTLAWTTASGAIAHRLASDTMKQGPFATLVAELPEGVSTLTMAPPPEPLVFYRMRGLSCRGEGP